MLTSNLKIHIVAIPELLTVSYDPEQPLTRPFGVMLLNVVSKIKTKCSVSALKSQMSLKFVEFVQQEDVSVGEENMTMMTIKQLLHGSVFSCQPLLSSIRKNNYPQTQHD